LAWEKAPGAEPMQRVAHVLAPLPETKPASALPHPAPAQPQRVRLPLPALPVHLPVSPKPAPAACTPKPSEDAKACVALDAKNVELRSQIAKLEQKVKVLQVSMQGKPAAAAAAARSPAPAAAQPPVAPEGKPAAKPAGPAPILPRKARKQVAPEEQGLPWLAIGSGAAALLALAGGGAWFVRRRRGKGEAPMPPAAVSREGIKSRLMGGP
jgi:pilus assembly protein FimV